MAKPHIRKSASYIRQWICDGDGVIGFGDTPAEAYTEWRKNWVEQKVFALF